jgi:hypothetical protein
MNRPIHHTIQWNGYRVEASAYVSDGLVEWEEINIYNDNGEEIGIAEYNGALTQVTRSTHVKNPDVEMAELFLEAEAEYHNDMELGSY